MSARARSAKAPFNWAVLLLSLPAGVAIWSGWVGIGTLCGFGKVTPLPGLLDGFVIDTRITLPIGMETYAALALRAWLTSRPGPVREYAKWSAIAALGVGAAGQVAYHLMSAAGYVAAPWPITVAVATLPVAVLGMGAALHHLTSASDDQRPAPAPSGDAEGPAKTAKTAKTPFVQVSGPEFRHTPSAKTPASSAKTPSGTPRRAAGTTAAAAELAAQVHALAAANPTWTQAQIGAEAGCSVRTVRRHLAAPAPAAPAVLGPVPTAAPTTERTTQPNTEAATEDAA